MTLQPNSSMGLVSYPRWVVALLLSINLINYVDRYVLAAVIPKIRAEFFSPGEKSAEFWVGLLATAFLVTYMFAAPVFGWLADRISKWLIMGLGVIVWSLASGATGLAQTYMALLLTRVFVGIGEAAYGPAAPTVIADLYPVERRGSVLAWFYMAIPVGSALGYVLGGFVAANWHWRWAFYLSLPPGIVLGICCLFLRDRTAVKASSPAGTRRRAAARDYLALARTPSYVFTTAGMTMMTFAVGGIAYWMPDYIHSFRGQPDLGRVNLVFGGLTAVSGLTATLLGGVIGDRLRPRFAGSYFLVSGIGMLVALPLFLLALVTPFPLAWVLIFCTEFCLFFNTGPTNTILANVTHPSIRATAFALNILVIHLLGDAISPPLIGAITDLAGGNMNVGFTVVSAAILFSGILWLAGAKHLARDTLTFEESQLST